jgi:hypothetical protein
LVALLARDVGSVLEGIPIEGRRIVWISYSGGGDAWLDAAWPGLAVAFEADLPSLGKAVRAEGWRAGWDLTGWSTVERDVELQADTQQALGATTAPLGEVDHVLREVAATLARLDLSDDSIAIAIDDGLAQLPGAVASLPERQAHRLRQLRLVPSVSKSQL